MTDDTYRNCGRALTEYVGGRIDFIFIASAEARGGTALSGLMLGFFASRAVPLRDIIVLPTAMSQREARDKCWEWIENSGRTIQIKEFGLQDLGTPVVLSNPSIVSPA